MSNWYYIVFGLSAVLVLWLVYKEAVRPNRQRRAIRIAAVIIAVAALTCIAIPPGFERALGPGVPAILLTEGYDKDSVSHFRQQTGAQLYKRGDSTAPAIHVFGYGLTAEEWNSFDPAGIPVVFHPALLGTGFGSVDWPERLSPGHPLTIQGVVKHSNARELIVKLTGFGTVLDSAKIKDAAFTLRTVPPNSGRALYHLLLLDQKDTLEQEAIPVEVQGASRLRILVLAGSPDFENKFLANWLHENGHALAVRTTISKGKKDLAWLNMGEMGLDHLTAAMLDRFDLVIADAAELEALPAPEMVTLRRQIADKGLGMVVKADSGKAEKGPATLPLQRDSLGRVSISEYLYGTGHIVTTTIGNTYPMLLSGNKAAYASLWSGILGSAARPDSASAAWHFYPSRPQVHQPTRIVLQYSADDPVYGQVNNSVVYFDQHPILPFNREGIFWAGQSGWQLASLPHGDSCWWYAWGSDDWRVATRSRRLEATRDFMDMERIIKPHEARQERAPISKGLFYLAFLACCIFLWVERKI